MEMAISRNRLEEGSRRLFQCLPVRVVASSLACGLLGAAHLVAYFPSLIDVFTAFRALNPEDIVTGAVANGDLRNPLTHVYSRYTQPVRTRTEQILSRINVGGRLMLYEPSNSGDLTSRMDML
jgi:hypothetical protein